MANGARPLSPHLSIYRWPITMTLSILHRVTGLALSAGFLVLTWWLAAAATGGSSYEAVAGLLGSIPGRVLLVGMTFAFFFHLANGIRHLVWDLGLGFEIRQANASSWAVIAATVLATALFWLVI